MKYCPGICFVPSETGGTEGLLFLTVWMILRQCLFTFWRMCGVTDSQADEVVRLCGLIGVVVASLPPWGAVSGYPLRPLSSDCVLSFFLSFFGLLFLFPPLLLSFPCPCYFLLTHCHCIVFIFVLHFLLCLIQQSHIPLSLHLTFFLGLSLVSFSTTLSFFLSLCSLCFTPSFSP